MQTDLFKSRCLIQKSPEIGVWLIALCRPGVSSIRYYKWNNTRYHLMPSLSSTQVVCFYLLCIIAAALYVWDMLTSWTWLHSLAARWKQRRDLVHAHWWNNSIYLVLRVNDVTKFWLQLNEVESIWTRNTFILEFLGVCLSIQNIKILKLFWSACT